MSDELTTTVYYDEDADVSTINDETVAVLGYGSQGHAHALNLHESGVDVIVGLRQDSSSWADAEDAGLRVETPDVAAGEADRVVMLVPDTIQPAVYEAIEDELDAGDTLQFAHGFNIHYGQIEPPEDVDVTMVAPKSPGHLVRRTYERGEGTPGLIAVYQDATGNAKQESLAYAKGIGCTRAGVIETSFQEEVETDLFGEQAVLCGGVTEMVKAGFETLVDAGYAPEMAYFECLNELKLIVDLMYEGGHMGMWNSVSDTAEYGGLTRGEEVIDREGMEKILEEVQNGEFAREWINENQANRPAYKQYRDAEQNHQIEAVGENLRELFAWGEDADAETTEAPADD
ncbi:ketol-acid reductoisomerase [Haloarcula marismortui ATCC 43049]|uniref:Ketol-acid reductoisomerase (NADP(+)) n=2 Tax=Haloarcula marismortui (strain ATCC 43049 / DSM 3752 / JCM 8966 / VKM B-1809) TaxID=272569 RepID=ILVC_HALMA|nr:ketol-acid reductoisomerase [Haloarcula marismortui]Q5V520.1 RecName: Full=Ketol-acid reductoisomerase (NADP(+)); Short=KARI; AltName: Full=Acetohydroxy-acid isomeroreductase; Short=AHIR; AltName: Full=Alpha-keto-beta-hydroxylacyl reductoisomerase; AltName: Full=Ketol-acid reductoisomerase type 1; AltName: Full=Ketol-acid reductoisomerase type I [Haloarcula marismortui ATCC 43049]AAV45382.1 ketol-acid reductoisomerase [Haloarcula marismortui ATCC 43049]QCP93158.1 ketol-acid reductoisomerase [